MCLKENNNTKSEEEKEMVSKKGGGRETGPERRHQERGVESYGEEGEGKGKAAK